MGEPVGDTTFWEYSVAAKATEIDRPTQSSYESLVSSAIHF